MTLRTSLIITGDSSGAKQAIQQLTDTTRVLGSAEQDVAAAGRLMAAAQAECHAAMIKEQTGASAMADELKKAHTTIATMAGRLDVLETRFQASGKAMRDGAVDAERHAFAVRNLGQQFGDMAVMIQGGISPARAFSTQAGQMGYAMSELGGKAGAVGKFLVGPWGIALTVGTAALAPLVEKLFQSADASVAAENAAESLGKRVGDIGSYFDTTTGKIKETNKALINFAILSRDKDRRAAIDVQQTAQKAGDAALKQSLRGDKVYVERGFSRDMPEFNRNFDVQDAIRSRKDIDDKLFAISRSGSRNASLASEILKQRATFQDQAKIIAKSDAEVRSLLSGVLDPSLRTGGSTQRTKRAGTGKERSAPSTVARDEFSRDAASTVAGIVAQFDGTPPVVRQVNAEVRKLADLIDDLARKKPVGFDKLISSAREAEKLILTGISKPYDDFIAAQDEALAVQRLVTAGRQDEADALRTIQGLQRSMGPLTDAQKDAVLATVQAMRAEAAAIDDLRARNAKYLDALGSIRGIVDDATQAFVRGDLGQLVKSPGKLLDAFQTLQGRKLFDRLFGGVFEDLRDQINGTSVVGDASHRMAAAVDEVSARSRDTAASFQSLRPPIADATNALAGFTNALGSASSAAGGSAVESDTDKLKRLFALGNGVTGPDRGGTGDIVVNGRRRQEPIDVFAGSIDKVFGKLGIKDPQLFGRSIGANAGKAFAGAAEGAAINSVLKPLVDAIGLKTSKTGAQIGGAVGSFVPLPFAKEAGAVLGSIVGGLFKKAKIGSAEITVGATGQFAAGSASGNSGAAKSGASGLAGEVAGTLNSIAATLGGTVAAISGLSIGTKNGKIHVNAVGGQIGKKGSGDIGFGQDEAAALAYAVNQAIAKGAVTGLSPAVAQAIRSSTDLEAAVQEALKVQNVETLMGGILGQYQKAFKDFEATARERVRIAGQYGFDVVAIEKRNAEDRLKIADQLAGAQAGSLKSLVAELTTGSLFEGTAMDRIAALNTAIGEAKADLDANVEGAGDRLAALYQQRLSASKSAYGSTGAYAADRTATIGDAQAAIAKINAQISAAQSGKVSDPALATTNAALAASNATLDENNDQNSQIINALAENNALLTRIVGNTGGSSSSFDLRALAGISLNQN